MFLTIVAVLCAIIGLIVMAAGKAMKPENKNRSSTRFTGISIFIVSLIVLAIACTTIVQPRTVGVKVALGKPTSVVSNGFHLKWPWEKVEKLDGSVQNDVYTGDSAIPVRLGNNGRADVDASIQWQLKTDDAMDVFLDYRTFEGIQSNLVDRNFRASLNEVMATYDPLEYGDSASGGQDLEGLAKSVQEKMQAKVKTQIEIRSVTLPIINFDEPTQNRINELQAETAKTRVAQQRKQTSTAEAEANKILERSLTNETLTSKCLDIVAESGQSPIGCFPNSGVQPITMTGDKQKESN
ncbi:MULTISPECIES: SPFH domain-containing protein [Glutamicibacter]|jgi:regulator of protease activity HflC (stomatin/prohibitin superfamily)|uniref:SPFH domain-containing protein n=2 Tax=Glutamicibacter arilaitensis TaxID=256701 RepID=A0A2N7RYF6_9MICC|nr:MULTISPECIES: SPFH domain-containing protein [Glutamicibacter]PMQ18933.1 SPFH domain-containing protein [Glutamicibacter arilaitensis]CBT77087.1 band 7 family protein [Glutamicibacter arilaitensis Re117]HCH47881.1 SPFH domain-containing protein [Glutamicibacter sp.]HCJ55664.1 SPFH domain-containing protein [Glutamicibacter sp.]HCM93065.1 SPFH domain-containing protein [Glutamicibacter sp.]